ncbi:hypothetical protein EG68_07036 [Paragonimus skrjabini miyazakii]|uniref:Uncharacterized protein n=1 Tax=Paragonimus skrjabini miyazakii TaxID=59628 RepID=A0A8S9YQS0_9TREM|nr:hypothetical protein EG68_07036 [Paragonimus skrjabini miyazakii]
MKRLSLLRWVNPMGDWEEDESEEVETSTRSGHADCVPAKTIDVLNNMLADTWLAAPVEDLSLTEVVGCVELLLCNDMYVKPEPGTLVQDFGPTNDGNSLSVGAFELQSVTGKGRIGKEDVKCLARPGVRTGWCTARTRYAGGKLVEQR